MEFVSGEVAFSNLTEHEKFQGESTGKYSVVITVDDDAAKKLEGQGIKLKNHEGKHQRAFKTKYEFQYVDTEKAPQEGELGRGSKVKVAYKLGEPYGEYGVTTFLQGIQVIERVEPLGSVDVFTVSEADVPDDDLPF
jgi:hypothetical protein